MTSLGRRVLAMVLLSALPAALLTSARAQAAGKRVPIQPFGILRWGGELYARVFAKKRDETYRNTTTNEKESLLEAGISGNADGYFYHPNLMAWMMQLRLARTKQDIQINGRDFKTDGNLKGYNLSAFFLKEKPVSFHVSASRTEDLRDRDFAQAVKVRDDRKLAEILTRGPFPMSLRLEKRKRFEEGDTRRINADTDIWRFSIEDQRDPDWSTKLVFRRENTAETADTLDENGQTTDTTDLPNRENEIRLLNNWRFGPSQTVSKAIAKAKAGEKDKTGDKAKAGEKGKTGDKAKAGEDATTAKDQAKTQELQKHSLTGDLRFLDRKGFYNNQVIAGNERLELRHSPTFSTYYLVTYSSDKVDAETEVFKSAQIGLRKHIYDSLDIDAHIEAWDRSFAGGKEKNFNGFLDMSYRKETPVGDYQCNLRLGREYEEDQSQSGRRDFRDERVTLTGIDWKELKQRSIVPGSIVVTNEDQTITYAPTVDYIIRRTGVVTEIARVIGGEIQDGDVVLVDYTARVPTNAKFSTNHVTWDQRLDIDGTGLSLYTKFRLRDETLQSGDDPGNLDKDRDYLAGVRWEWKELVLTFEHGIRTHELSPSLFFDRFRVEYAYQFNRDWDLTAGGSVERLRYTNGDEFGLEPEEQRLDSVRGYLTVTGKLNANTVLRYRGSYSKSRGRENRMLARNSVELEWRQGKLDFSLEARHDIFDQEGNQGTDDVLLVKIRRAF